MGTRKDKNLQRYPDLDRHLREARRIAGVTVSQLADAAGMNWHFIQNIAMGLTTTPERVEKIAGTLGLTAEQLTSGDVAMARVEGFLPAVDPKRLASNLSRARSEAGLNRATLSLMIGRNPAYVQMLEKERVMNPPSQMIRDLEEALMLPPGALLAGEIDGAQPNPRLLPGPRDASKIQSRAKDRIRDA